MPLIQASPGACHSRESLDAMQHATLAASQAARSPLAAGLFLRVCIGSMSFIASTARHWLGRRIADGSVHGIAAPQRPAPMAMTIAVTLQTQHPSQCHAAAASAFSS